MGNFMTTRTPHFFDNTWPVLAAVFLFGAFDQRNCCWAQPTPPSTQPQPVAPSGLRVISGFECSAPVGQVDTLEPDHLLIRLGDAVNFDGWLIRLEGVAGKTVRIDIKCTRKLNKWKTLNPVYARGDLDLNDPALYVAEPSKGEVRSTAGVRLPDTAGQQWHYIADAKLVDNTTFTMTQTFDTDTVWLGNRVPHPPGYEQRFMRGLAGNPLVKVVEIGTLDSGRPLLMAQIDGDGDAAAVKTKPCVLIAGGEQAIQVDGMWSAQGAIEYLLGDDDAAKQLRQHCRFLIIPMLDPDGTANMNMRFAGSFFARRAGAAAIAYASFFQRWVAAGNRLDAVLEVHNVQSLESPHLSRAYIEGGPGRGALAEALHGMVLTKFRAVGLQSSPALQTTSVAPTRFGTWLSFNYGPIVILYEINAQDPTRHLDLAQLKATGGLFARAAGEFLSSPRGEPLLSSVDAARAKHNSIWANSPATNPTQNAIDAEAAAREAAGGGGGNGEQGL
jgi:hypothetical protein